MSSDLTTLKASVSFSAGSAYNITMVTSVGFELRISYISNTADWGGLAPMEPGEAQISFFEKDSTIIRITAGLSEREAKVQFLHDVIERYVQDTLLASLLAAALEDRLHSLLLAIVETPAGVSFQQENLVERLCRNHSGPIL